MRLAGAAAHLIVVDEIEKSARALLDVVEVGRPIDAPASENFPTVLAAMLRRMAIGEHNVSIGWANGRIIINALDHHNAALLTIALLRLVRGDR